MVNASKAYSEIEITTDVMTASNHRLIELLFNKCLQRIEMAKHFMAEKEFIKKSESIQKAFNIIQHLRQCLNHDDPKTQEIARLLDSLYAYAQSKLFEANMKDNLTYIEEAKKIIVEIKSGWEGIKQEEKNPA